MERSVPSAAPIVVFDPGRELTFSLFHHGFERLGSDAGDELQGYESGWHSRHLEALKEIVEG